MFLLMNFFSFVDAPDKSPESPIPFEQRPRSYTDSEGFFEDVSDLTLSI